MCLVAVVGGCGSTEEPAPAPPQQYSMTANITVRTTITLDAFGKPVTHQQTVNQAWTGSLVIQPVAQGTRHATVGLDENSCVPGNFVGQAVFDADRVELTLTQEVINNPHILRLHALRSGETISGALVCALYTSGSVVDSGTFIAVPR